MPSSKRSPKKSITLVELKKQAKSLGIKGYSTLKKAELEAKIENFLNPKHDSSHTSSITTMDKQSMKILNALTPFYIFNRGMNSEAMISPEDFKLLKPVFKKWGPISYEEDEQIVYPGPYQTGKSFHKTDEERVIYTLTRKAQEHFFENVTHIVLEEVTRPEYTGAVVEWKQGTNTFDKNENVSMLQILRVARNLGFNDDRGVDKFDFVSHEGNKLVLKAHIDNYST